MKMPKPVTLDQIIGGQPYIHVGVARDGEMWIEHHTFLGQPFKGWGELWCLKTKKRAAAIFVTDYGLNPNHRYNNHRVFRHNHNNLQLLERLVRDQNVAEYLKLIGVKNIEGAILKMKEARRAWDALEDDMDEIFFSDDVDDPDEGLDHEFMN